MFSTNGCIIGNKLHFYRTITETMKICRRIPRLLSIMSQILHCNNIFSEQSEAIKTSSVGNVKTRREREREGKQTSEAMMQKSLKDKQWPV